MFSATDSTLSFAFQKGKSERTIFKYLYMANTGLIRLCSARIKSSVGTKVFMFSSIKFRSKFRNCNRSSPKFQLFSLIQSPLSNLKYKCGKMQGSLVPFLLNLI